MNTVVELIRNQLPWVPEEIHEIESVPKGDMPGDSVQIGPQHIMKAQKIFPILLDLLIPVLERNPWHRAVISVCGGSGVGKSEIASLITFFLNRMKIGSYTLSGDNYPHRIPHYNDAERVRIFRKSGIDGLILQGLYFEEIHSILKAMQESGNDSNPDLINQHQWLSVYQQSGRKGLGNYLGTSNEIDFEELSGIVSRFKEGESEIFLKRMGRESTDLWYEPVDFRNMNILIIEWTHGNSDNLRGVDIPVLLNSTPQETLEHRRSRKRDQGTGNTFTTMVLEIEQELLISQASKAKLIVSKNGEILTYGEFRDIMIRNKQT